MGSPCSKHGKDEKCIKILVEKAEEKRQLVRTKRRWKRIYEWILKK
jgi:hypothetical protein